MSRQGKRQNAITFIAAAAVAAVFTLPAIGQSATQSSTAQVQTGTSTANTTNSELGKYNSQYATGQPLQTQSHEGFWGHLNPLARKKWVNRQVTPVKDRLNELDQLTATNAQGIKDLDARTQAGLKQADDAAALADSHATVAGNTATQAQQLAQQSSTKTAQLDTTVNGLDQYQSASQIEIRFHGGQSALGDNAKAALDQVASQLQGQHGYLIDVQGYSSLRGQAGVNASRKMAAAVTRYLVTEHQIPLYRIRQIALGHTPIATQDQDASTTHYRGSIVEVNVMHNSLSALSASNTGGSPIGATQPNPAQSSSNGVASQPTQ
ncbi:MAG TPA: OmpA family protein [Acidobacteriaceae bacterium]|jgi:outer membrane protein OmpA-like peptidoglycan-associated protein|nr:OmpA family protein [Acidobacteriaceae bacterium]